MQARLGVAPIAWSNDDLPELGGDTPLETCLREAAEAGFTGIETGGKFPAQAAELGPLLKQFRLSLCGGWYSGTVLTNDPQAEKDQVHTQLTLFRELQAPCLVYGETAHTIQNIRNAPLRSRIRLDDAQIRTYGHRLTEFSEYCADAGMPIAFHHHMGTAIESEQDVDRLMNHTGEAVHLLYDPGHMAFAGGDVMRVIEKHARRVTHFHAKDVRRRIIDGLDRNRESFLDAVLKGAFTVPGDGGLDFPSMISQLAELGYQGWFVVEAEQDPAKAPPDEYAKIGYATLHAALAAAGYRIMDGEHEQN
ncbi:MAG: myo-inosose-2 dehydratase [Rhodobacteraceae bacterium]|nr:myo-inosose-2 dehydratase [Paracoccaceae bacterium]